MSKIMAALIILIAGCHPTDPHIKAYADSCRICHDSAANGTIKSMPHYKRTLDSLDYFYWK